MFTWLFDQQEEISYLECRGKFILSPKYLLFKCITWSPIGDTLSVSERTNNTAMAKHTKREWYVHRVMDIDKKHLGCFLITLWKRVANTHLRDVQCIIDILGKIKNNAKLWVTIPVAMTGETLM